MVKKTIIEARINEYAMRTVNPHVPWSLGEIVEDACRVRDAGASILHFHARTKEGEPNNHWEAYAEIITAIRQKTDILLLPTLGFNSNDKDGFDRIKIIAELAKHPETKPDIIPLDMGSVNLERYDYLNKTFKSADVIYQNTSEVLEFCAKEMLSLGIKVKMTCWDMGFVRRGAIFLEDGLITKPGYFLFHFTEGEYITAHPATKIGVDSLRSVLPDESCYWSVNCLGGNLMHLVPYVLRKGGNIAIGLGDYHYKEMGNPRNCELISKINSAVLQEGNEVATPEEVKMMLGIGL
ncbi:MAG: 3-keto-5-aminohexanoate cleavage protein [Sphaerochaetaceae bacterium]